MRVPWKKVFGITLSEWVARERAKGLTREQAFQKALEILEANKQNLPKVFLDNYDIVVHNLWQSISARWGQSNTLIKSYVSEKRALGVWSARIRMMKDEKTGGTGLGIFLSPKAIEILDLQEDDALVVAIKKIYRRRDGKWAYVEKEGARK